MCLKRGYGIFNSILQSNPNNNAKLQNLIKREGGVYFDYQDSKDKQVLDLHFYWKEYTPTIPQNHSLKPHKPPPKKYLIKATIKPTHKKKANKVKSFKKI